MIRRFKPELFPCVGKKGGYNHKEWVIDIHFRRFKTIQFRIHFLDFFKFSAIFCLHFVIWQCIQEVLWLEQAVRW